MSDVIVRGTEPQVFTTLDGSRVRELLHPRRDGPGALSLAEAVVPPGGQTHLHRHRNSEEIYHIQSGAGSMELAGERFAVAGGDTIRISPGSAHRLFNPGPAPLVVLCCCSPAYADADTELVDARDNDIKTVED